jgi:hypothetical protein
VTFGENQRKFAGPNIVTWLFGGLRIYFLIAGCVSISFSYQLLPGNQPVADAGKLGEAVRHRKLASLCMTFGEILDTNQFVCGERYSTNYVFGT